MKKSISSIELAAIVNELQFLVRGKISKIYDHGDKEIVLQIHSGGKHYLRIFAGKLLNLTTKKESPIRPTGFCMQLRKYLDNATITKLEQKDSERIVVIELEKKEKFFVIIELFSKGNVILTNSGLTIIGVLERQLWKGRMVKPHENYSFPEPKNDWNEMAEEWLGRILKGSEKKNLATCLATEIGLGGVYAEEVCKLAQVDKNFIPKDLGSEQTKALMTALTRIKEFISKPQGCFYEDNITPFPLQDRHLLKTTETYNEALDTINPNEVVSPYQKKIAALEKQIAQQEEALVSQQEKIDLNAKKGETIYENYTPLQGLLDVVDDLRKNHEWKDIEKELRKEKNIVGINLKGKKITINL